MALVTMLTAGELESMQAEVQRVILTDTVVVERRARISDNEGGWTVGTPVEVYHDVGQVEVTGLTPQERDVAGRYQAVQYFSVSLLPTADVTTTDRVLWNGRTFEVVATRGPVTNEIVREVLAVEVT
jgi:head-tail adaptor